MDIDYGTVAVRIVKDCMRLGKKDSLGVHTTEHMLPLAKEIVKAARKAGADTLISVDSDDIWYDALLNLPVQWLKSPSPLGQAFRDSSTANVYIEGPRDPRRMREIPEERWLANDKGARETYSKFDNRPVPSVDLSISRVTEERARVYGLDFGEWFSSTLQAMAADPKIMAQRAMSLAKPLSHARKGRLTAPGGTDFMFQFHGAAPTISTGEIRPKKGNKASFFSSLPDGQLSFALRKGSGEGRMVSTTPIPQAGLMIRGLSWEFKGGRVKEFGATENVEAFKMMFSPEKRKKGADQLGWLSIGLNPGAKFGFLNNSIVEGAVSLGIGDNSTLGGTNVSDYGFAIFLDDATLEVDGKKVVVGGRLVA